MDDSNRMDLADLPIPILGKIFDHLNYEDKMKLYVISTELRARLRDYAVHLHRRYCYSKKHDIYTKASMKLFEEIIVVVINVGFADVYLDCLLMVYGKGNNVNNLKISDYLSEICFSLEFPLNEAPNDLKQIPLKRVAYFATVVNLLKKFRGYYFINMTAANGKCEIQIGVWGLYISAKLQHQQFAPLQDSHKRSQLVANLGELLLSERLEQSFKECRTFHMNYWRYGVDQGSSSLSNHTEFKFKVVMSKRMESFLKHLMYEDFDLQKLCVLRPIQFYSIHLELDTAQSIYSYGDGITNIPILTMSETQGMRVNALLDSNTQ